MKAGEELTAVKTETGLTTAGGAIVEGSINVQGGDFVGRDKAIFSQYGQRAAMQVNVAGDVVYERKSEILDSITAQIARLRGRISRLIPAEESIVYLADLREPATITDRIGGELSITVPFLLGSLHSRLFTRPVKNKKTGDRNSSESHLENLSRIEYEVSPDLDEKKLSELLQHLSNLTDEVNVRISRLNNAFVGLAYPATSSVELVANIVSKIGHRELHEEAKMHLGVIGQLVRRLDLEKLTGQDLDVLSDEAQSAVGVMTEIEKHRLVVERLLQADRGRRNLTITVVIVYIAIAIVLTVFLASRWATQFIVGRTSLNEMRLPLLGIPWPVIVWSMIGSFAAMVNRFNRRPIYDFGDAVKWMLTRPVQGVVLGSAFYLALVSGLFLLTGSRATDNTGLVTADEVILVLSFLVGFSDRFADSVFRTLVDRYSRPAESVSESTDQESQE